MLGISPFFLRFGIDRWSLLWATGTTNERPRKTTAAHKSRYQRTNYHEHELSAGRAHRCPAAPPPRSLHTRSRPGPAGRWRARAWHGRTAARRRPRRPACVVEDPWSQVNDRDAWAYCSMHGQYAWAYCSAQTPKAVSLRGGGPVVAGQRSGCMGILQYAWAVCIGILQRAHAQGSQPAWWRTRDRRSTIGMHGHTAVCMGSMHGRTAARTRPRRPACVVEDPWSQVNDRDAWAYCSMHGQYAWAYCSAQTPKAASLRGGGPVVVGRRSTRGKEGQQRVCSAGRQRAGGPTAIATPLPVGPIHLSASTT